MDTGFCTCFVCGLILVITSGTLYSFGPADCTFKSCNNPAKSHYYRGFCYSDPNNTSVDPVIYEIPTVYLDHKCLDYRYHLTSILMIFGGVFMIINCFGCMIYAE